MGGELKMTKQFKQRLLFSSIGILALIVSIYHSYSLVFRPFFLALAAAIVGSALLEYYRLAKHKDFHPLVLLGIGSSVIYLFVLGFSFFYPFLIPFPPLVLLVALLVSFLILFNQKTPPLVNLAVTWFGIAYLTIPLSYALRLNYLPLGEVTGDGRLWLGYVLAVSKMTDIGAYFVGKKFGKTLLAPSISPKKTIEGALGGLFGACVITIPFYFLFSSTSSFPIFPFSSLQMILLSIVLSFLAQLGDLSESLLKRDAGVKDSNRLPGLGGMLDMVDSLIFTIPFLYFFLQIQT